MHLPPELETLLSRTLPAYGLVPDQIDFLRQEAGVLGERRGTLAVARAAGQYFAVLLVPVLLLPEPGPDFGQVLMRITQAVELYPGSSLTLEQDTLYLAGCHPLSLQQEADTAETIGLLWEMAQDTHARLSEALAARQPDFHQPALHAD